MDDRIRAAFDAIHAEEALKEHTKAALAARQRPAVRRRRLAPLLACLALVVALQVWLCRKGKWLGLILPAITLAMSLMICLSVVGFSAVTGGGSVQVTDGHGNIVEEYHREEEHHQLQPADLAMVGGVFLVFNVPTLVLGGIWLYYKNRREWKEDLKKMNIQDLE